MKIGPKGLGTDKDFPSKSEKGVKGLKRGCKLFGRFSDFSSENGMFWFTSTNCFQMKKFRLNKYKKTTSIYFSQLSCWMCPIIVGSKYCEIGLHH